MTGRPGRSYTPGPAAFAVQRGGTTSKKKPAAVRPPVFLLF
jgi:hypothetical protein